MRRKIFKTGHSLAITVSRQALDELGLKLGDSVKVEVDKTKGHLLIFPDAKGQQLILNISSRPSLGNRI